MFSRVDCRVGKESEEFGVPNWQYDDRQIRASSLHATLSVFQRMDGRPSRGVMRIQGSETILRNCWDWVLVKTREYY